MTSAQRAALTRIASGGMAIVTSFEPLTSGPPSALVAVTRTWPLRWLTSSTPSSSISALSVGAPSASVTVHVTSWYVVSSGVNSAV